MIRDLQPSTNRGTNLALPILAILLLTLTAFAAPAFAQQHYLLAVGIDQYDPAYGAGSLPSCVNDATGFKDVLLRDANRWDASRTALLTNSDATRENIRAALRQMARLAGPGDVCVYFQSSHGGQYSGASTFLCTHDADYSDQELGQDLSAFDAQTTVIVVVDACHSGGLFKDGSPAKPIDGPQAWTFAENVMSAFHKTKAAAAEINGEAPPKDAGGNIGFITACDYNQTCAAGNPYSLFAGQMIRAFQESGVDSNNDGVRSFWELYAWAAPRATQANRGQTAQTYNQGLLSETIATANLGAAEGESRRPDGANDQFEPNNTRELAKRIGNGTYQLVCRDQDWFKVTCRPGPFSIKVEGTEGDLDLCLLDMDGNLLGRSDSYSSNESLEGEVADSGEAYVVIAAYQGQGGGYTLTLSIPGNEGGTATPTTVSLCGSSAALPLMATLAGLIGFGTASRRRARFRWNPVQ